MARLPGADPVPLVLDGVDLHPDATALLHATVATLVALVLVNDALALKPEAKNRHSFFLTTPIASPRQGIWLTRPDPLPQIEATLSWVPVQKVEPSCTS